MLYKCLHAGASVLCVHMRCTGRARAKASLRGHRAPRARHSAAYVRALEHANGARSAARLDAHRDRPTLLEYVWPSHTASGSGVPP